MFQKDIVPCVTDLKPSIIGKKKPMAAKKGVSQTTNISLFLYHMKLLKKAQDYLFSNMKKLVSWIFLHIPSSVSYQLKAEDAL